ncbi:MAG TPA: type I methionyl aminopeptidase [bacterium]|nr:type I methionyl aminopeptidase [bacterium]
MITIKSKEEIKILREGGNILALVLNEVSAAAKPGITAIELDALAEKLIRRAGGEPSFKNYKTGGDKPFPASLCVSVNSEIVHGIPSKDKILKEGDIAGLDLGLRHKGLYTDMAITVPVGAVSEEVRCLVEAAKKSLDAGISAVKDGAHIGDIGFAVQQYAELQGFSVVKKLVGHGVGYGVHEEPEIPNYGKLGTGPRLKEGMVLALEPMINKGGDDIILSGDGWTWETKDGSLSVHFEHTVAVTKSGAEVLTMK